jgi:L-lactate dehydrogenase complex protein LldF
MEIKTDSFKENSVRALANPKLQAALKKAMTTFVEKRRHGVAEVANWEELRDQGRRIKEDVIDNLDRYLAEFEKNARARGAKVFRAADGPSAVAYVLGLAREKGIKLAIKAKSMATEEIELNEFLESVGVEPVETDLGEYIVQLAHEKPSHILAPAIHKSRFDIADLFAERLKTERTDEVEKLTAIARRTLRMKFIEAGMGVSGGNFGVAETGTVVLFENEGNIRMTTTLPRVHVVVMGIEKLIPKFEDLAVFLTLLPRSGTGQKMTSYVSMITGVKSEWTDEGPEELHIILLDNGRSRIAKDEVLKESLYCLRCGACLNVCPVYRKVGGHAYGWIYSGPIGALVTPEFLGLDRAKDLPYASSLCGACKDVCPVKINIPSLLLELRSGVVEKVKKTPLAERVAMKLWSVVVKSERLYALASGVARFMQVAFVSDGTIRDLPFPFSQWTKGRDLPPLAERSFRELWRERKASTD